MKCMHVLRSEVVVLGILAAVLIGSGHARADFTFGQPVNLGPTVNSPASEGVPCVSADGLELYFASYREGGFGQADIWVCTRESTESAWGPAENLGPVLNTPLAEWQMAISTDGLELYFQVWEPDASGSVYTSGEIWVTRRATKGEPWGQPEKLELTAPNGDLVAGPSLTADGLELHFCTGRFGNEPRAELYVAKRETVEAPWGEPVSLGPVVNDGTCKVDARVSSDGLLLVFSDWWACSPRPGGLGNADMWMIRRTTRDEDWGPPVNLGSPVNSPLNDRVGTISADGSTLYFYSNRGGSGSNDLWQAPILPVVDLDDDGNVGLNDLLTMIESWGTAEPRCDIGPMPWGDGVVDAADLEVLMERWGESSPVSIVVDDFESYNDDDAAGTTIWNTWIDGWSNGSGSLVGYMNPPFAELGIVHGGLQAMPYEYHNDATPFFSEANRTWEEPQDWTRKGVAVLSLWVHGDPEYVPTRQTLHPLYVVLQDAAGNSAAVVHPDPAEVRKNAWHQWSIPLAQFAGMDATKITMMGIGVGDTLTFQPGGVGKLFFDDIELHPADQQ